MDLAWLAGLRATLLTVEGFAFPGVEGTAAAAIAAVLPRLVGLGAVLVAGLRILLAVAALVEPGRASLERLWFNDSTLRTAFTESPQVGNDPRRLSVGFSRLRMVS